MRSSEEIHSAPISTLKRLACLLVCVGVGALVGILGSTFTGSTYWYIAIPAAVAVGWMFLANPSACEPSARIRGRTQRGKHNAP